MRPFEFRKSYRILKRPEFVFLSTYGKKLQDKNFIIVYSPGKIDHSRLGITVSKRVGNAVLRNRLKRLIREYFRLNRKNISGCWDLNIIAKKTATKISSQQLFMSLETLFGKMRGKNN